MKKQVFNKNFSHYFSSNAFKNIWYFINVVIINKFILIRPLFNIILLSIILVLVIFQTNITDTVKSHVISFSSLLVLIVINCSLIFLQADRSKKDRKQKNSENIVPFIQDFIEILCTNHSSNTIKKNKLKDSLKKLDREILFLGTAVILYQWREVYVNFESIIENNTVDDNHQERIINFLWLVKKQVGHDDTIGSKRYKPFSSV